jgi:hypothetical protein
LTNGGESYIVKVRDTIMMKATSGHYGCIFGAILLGFSPARPVLDIWIYSLFEFVGDS